MAEWLVKSIGQLCDEGLAEVQTGPFGSQLHAYEYISSGIPVVPTEAIRARRIDHSVLPKIRKEKADELKRQWLIPGDILFARRGAQATGHTAYVREEEAGFICGTGAIRLRVKAPFRQVLPEFLSHVFANPASVDWFKFHAIGATMPNLNEGIIRAFTLALPPVADQQAIATLLSALDDKIELNRQMNETLEALARAIFKDWFVDFGPTCAKADASPPYLAPDLWPLFPDTLDDEDKPEGWCIKTLGSEFNLTMGQSPPGETYNDNGNGMPFFQGRTDFGFRYPNLRMFCTAPTRIAEFDDTLVSVRAPVGDLNLSWEQCCIGRGIAAIRHKSGSRSFTYYTLLALQGELRAYEHTGTVFGAINKQQFEAMEFICPGQIMIRVFEDVSSPFDERIRANTLEIATLAQLRDLLLPKLMSGEIRLKDAEKAVEAVA